MKKKQVAKKFMTFLVAFIMVISLITPFDVTKVLAAENNITLQILATSDVHGRFMPYDYATDSKDLRGSLAQVATKVKELRKNNPNTILIDNGDSIQDNSSALFINDNPHPMMFAMNKIGYDVWVLGNHEFNYGIDNLNKISSQFKGAVLAGNLYKNGNRQKDPYKIIEIGTEKEKVKVGIIGLTNPNIKRWDGPLLKNYEVKDVSKEARKYADEIKDKVDIIIISCHVGENTEYSNTDSAREIAKAVPEAALVIAGHAHTSVNTREGNVLIVEPNKWAREISKVDITLTKNQDGKYVLENQLKDVKGQAISMNNIEPDKELVEALKPSHEKALKDAGTVIGELKGGDLVPPNEIKGITQSQIQDTAMIDLINKAQLKYSGADVSAAAVFKNDANMKKGPITKSGMTSIYKFDNTLIGLEVTGKQLKKYMEWTANYFNTYKDGDLTVSFNPEFRGYLYDMFSGVNYDIDISKNPGERITNLTYSKNGVSVKDTDKIKLCINNYRASSNLLGDLFKGENIPVYFDSEKLWGDDGRIRDLIRRYILEEKGGVITPEVDNNWKIVGNNWDKDKREKAKELINNGTIALPENNSRAITWNDLKSVVPSEDKIIDVLSINDLHGSLMEHGKNIGVAKLAAQIKKLKSENPNTIMVAGGDLYQGSAMSNLLKGEPITKFLKEVGVEISAVGNHEFDWGRELIPKWAKEGGFEFIASNIYDEKTNKPVDWALPYKVIEKDGKKIGFIGLATPETAFKTKPDNVKGLEFKDPAESANYWAKYLKDKENVDAVLILSHIGGMQNQDTKEITGEVADLANKVKGVDAIISAHTHQFLDGEVNNIPIIQAMCNGRALAKISLVFDKNGNLAVKHSVDQLYKRVKELPVDSNTEAIVNKYNEQLKPILSEVVCNVDCELPHDRWLGLSPLGQFMTKYMTEVTNTKIGITNGGGLRRPLNKGDITVGDLWEVMPFDNTLVTMNLKGSDLKRVLENGIENTQIGWGQFYGVKVYYDKNAKEGNRITSMRLLDGTKIDDDKYYPVVTNDFMYANGDNYDFSGAKDVVDTGEPIRDAIMNKLKEVKNVPFKFDDSTLVAGVDPKLNDNEVVNPSQDIKPNENNDTINNNEVITESPNESILDDNNQNKDNKVSKTNKNNKKSDIPKTGSIVGTNEAAELGMALIILGIFVEIDKKRKRKIS